MFTYKIANGKDGNMLGLSRSDGWFIPMDPANTDYQQYLAWIAEGNQPLPAEEQQ